MKKMRIEDMPIYFKIGDKPATMEEVKAHLRKKYSKRG